MGYCKEDARPCRNKAADVQTAENTHFGPAMQENLPPCPDLVLVQRHENDVSNFISCCFFL
jgi:hypothetical protein